MKSLTVTFRKIISYPLRLIVYVTGFLFMFSVFAYAVARLGWRVAVIRFDELLDILNNSLEDW